jgi:hypothetical protein
LARGLGSFRVALGEHAGDHGAHGAFVEAAERRDRVK